MLFYKRITTAIKDSKYTQKQIAKILNISESNISNWKKNNNLPSVDLLYKVCLLLEVSADYLLGLEDDYGEKIYQKIDCNNSNINSFNNNSGTINFKQ